MVTRVRVCSGSVHLRPKAGPHQCTGLAGLAHAQRVEWGHCWQTPVLLLRVP